MCELGDLIYNEFSVEVIGIMNLRLDNIIEMVEGNMEPEVYESIADKLTDLLVEATRDFFIQGFLRGIAVVKGGAV